MLPRLVPPTSHCQWPRMQNSTTDPIVSMWKPIHLMVSSLRTSRRYLRCLYGRTCSRWDGPSGQPPERRGHVRLVADRRQKTVGTNQRDARFEPCPECQQGAVEIFHGWDGRPGVRGQTTWRENHERSAVT